MIRQISPGPALTPEPQPAAAVTPAAEATTTAAALSPAPAETRDALAGALPAWDLLPASPFIRRVK